MHVIGTYEKRKEEELQYELTILNRSFPWPYCMSTPDRNTTPWCWTLDMFWNCTKSHRQKLLTREVSRINSRTWLQTLKHTFKLFPSKEYSGTHACTCWTTFWVLRYFHVHAVFIPLVQTFSKIRSMAPSNLSGVSISRSIICWVKVWNFWGVSLFRILLTLRNKS